MKKLILVILALAFAASLAACSATTDDENGTLALSLTDAATDQYRAVYVTIDEIQVHLSGNENSPNNWKSVAMPTTPMTVNLLDLINGFREDLGLVSLSSGHYTQLRLIIGRMPDGSLNVLSQRHPHANYVIDQDNPANVHELRIPSAYNTGVKIVRGFDIGANRTTELILDFDAARSVVQAGTSGNWLLKPTIRVGELAEYAIIVGSVTTNIAPVDGIEGALVSVQHYNGAVADPKDEVSVEAATITDENGDYQLFVAPGAYNLVVYAAGKQVSFSEISVGPEATVVEDRVLADAHEGRVEGTVAIAGADTVEQYATISFRQAVTGASQEKMIEVQSINVLNGAAYSTGLPANAPAQSYAIVGSTFGYRSQSYPVPVTEGGTTARDITIATVNP